MKIIGNDGKIYATVEECEKAEKALAEAKAKAKAEKEALAAARKERAKEVEDAYKTYKALLKKFLDDYGSFHTSFHSDDWFDFFPFNF